MTLQAEVALVTGASRGIGLAIALELGRKGAFVVGTATSQGGADSIGQQLSAADIKGRGAVLNVTDGASIEALLKEMEGSCGMPSILVNNAGITRDNLLLRMSEEEWDAILNTNLKSVYRMSKAVLRSMTKARKGRIISISSVVGAAGNAGQTNYAAAKAGIVGFTKALAREVGSRHITVNAVAPTRNARRSYSRSRSGGSAPRRILRTLWHSWPHRLPATSPDTHCMSTGGCTWREGPLPVGWTTLYNSC